VSFLKSATVEPTHSGEPVTTALDAREVKRFAAASEKDALSEDRQSKHG
jgi:hypothetical protein